MLHGRALKCVVKSASFNFIARVQLVPVKNRFIEVASWIRGRDARIALIKNLLRDLTKSGPRRIAKPRLALCETFIAH